jgi:hypothetical protein
MSYYTGKEVCQGCKKTGLEIRRWGKNELCENCKSILKLGKSKDYELKQEYVLVRDWHHGLKKVDFYDQTLDIAMTKLFSALDNKSANIKETFDSLRSQHLGCQLYTIPKQTFEPIQNLFKKLNEIVLDLKAEKENIPALVKNEINEESEVLFNSGVVRGKNLLIGLSSVDITLNDFDKKQTINL